MSNYKTGIYFASEEYEQQGWYYEFRGEEYGPYHTYAEAQRTRAKEVHDKKATKHKDKRPVQDPKDFGDAM